ncbi:hypothetical protein [Motilimonas pumila]|uniref:hypothetical protein n=1 Tax=Motilimonas pumila TaxID=2303987 RepID=UPI0013141B72|nr:hypothetical protein [Motilimonas pumila]
MNIVYYDFEIGYGVNATFQTGECYYFATMEELKCECLSRFGTSYDLYEITSDNYQFLCDKGVFDNVSF